MSIFLRAAQMLKTKNGYFWCCATLRAQLHRVQIVYILRNLFRNYSSHFALHVRKVRNAFHDATRTRAHELWSATTNADGSFVAEGNIFLIFSDVRQHSLAKPCNLHALRNFRGSRFLVLLRHHDAATGILDCVNSLLNSILSRFISCASHSTSISMGF